MTRRCPLSKRMFHLIIALLMTAIPLRSAAQICDHDVPNCGRLTAIGADGAALGLCPLKHTDVNVEIGGMAARVTVTQQFVNTTAQKIEAVYTFPLSERAAVDRMVMTIGERVIEAEIREREAARRIYEEAKQANRVAALLEQERPNIFTQSVANIEPGAVIDIEISYIELIEFADGVFSFAFPTISPRYIPGNAQPSAGDLPAELRAIPGAVLQRPVVLRMRDEDTPDTPRRLNAYQMRALLERGTAIEFPGALWWGLDESGGGLALPDAIAAFEAVHDDGAVDLGFIFPDNLGVIGDRWFYAALEMIDDVGVGMAADTDQVPDASRVTPEPVTRRGTAGHKISIACTIDTGGAGIDEIDCELHAITKEPVMSDVAGNATKVRIALASEATFPNRDFVLKWGTTAGAIEESILTHRSEGGGFVTLMLQPPARVEPEHIRPRELIFVMDTSGSMSGLPIEKSKGVLLRAVDAMRADDTFNVITFSGFTSVLWDQPRPATAANRAAAIALIESQDGGGGTEMMRAIDAALRPTRADPNDNNEPDRMRIVMFLTDGNVGDEHAIIGAVRKYAGTTRVFSFGIGNSVNRYLLRGVAEAGRGEVEFVTQMSAADEAIERFVRRIQNPVLTDIEIETGGGLVLNEIVPLNVADRLPDLYDQEPILIHARYEKPGEGNLILRGRTGFPVVADANRSPLSSTMSDRSSGGSIGTGTRIARPSIVTRIFSTATKLVNGLRIRCSIPSATI